MNGIVMNKKKLKTDKCRSELNVNGRGNYFKSSICVVGNYREIESLSCLQNSKSFGLYYS